MNAYQRLSLINEIAVKLQQEMSTSKINLLLSAYGIKNNGETIVKSKRVHVQNKLSDVNINTLKKIALDIEIPLENYEINKRNVKSINVWLPNKIKVFISHLAKDKDKASKIQYYLLRNEISGFVAHEDIEPSVDWMESILYALDTMDFLVALVTPGFHNSIWTNQEIGYAIGNNKKVITVKIGEDPKGFAGKYQAIAGKDRYPKDIVNDIVKIIKKE